MADTSITIGAGLLILDAILDSRRLWLRAGCESLSDMRLLLAINDGYYRITIVGSICHFVANLTTYNPNYGNPYSYPYYGYYNYYNPYGMAPSTYASSEMRQYLLDFNTGRILDYNVESVEILLMTDPELHDEFARLRTKKQKQLKFLYVRKFNEKHPLYFPKN